MSRGWPVVGVTLGRPPGLMFCCVDPACSGVSVGVGWTDAVGDSVQRSGDTPEWKEDRRSRSEGVARCPQSDLIDRAPEIHCLLLSLLAEL